MGTLGPLVKTEKTDRPPVAVVVDSVLQALVAEAVLVDVADKEAKLEFPEGPALQSFHLRALLDWKPSSLSRKPRRWAEPGAPAKRDRAADFEGMALAAPAAVAMGQKAETAAAAAGARVVSQ